MSSKAVVGMTKKFIIRQSFFSAKLSDLVFFMGRKYKSKILPEDFNARLYLELYPDVAAANADAAEHYISQGVREGRPYRYEGLPDDFMRCLCSVGWTVR